MKKILSCFTVLMSIFLIGAAWAEEVSQDARTSYNRGVDFYKKKDYNKAKDKFLKALNTQNRHLEQWTNYNLGNSYFEDARNAEEKNPQAALLQYRNALEFFRRAIEIDNQDKDAKYNFELTARKIKALEQKIKEQQKEQEEQKEKQQKPQEEKSEERKQQATEAKEKPQPQEKEKKPVSLQQEKERKEMTKEEATMLLDNFQQEEKTQQELLQEEKQREEPAVSKDW